MALGRSAPLRGAKFPPDAGTVPIGPRGTVRFLKQEKYRLKITAEKNGVKPRDINQYIMFESSAVMP